MIDDYLKLFNRDGAEYKKLIFDREKKEKAQIQRPNDINQGALHNVLEWHKRAALNFAERMSLRKAAGLLVNLWAEFWGIARPEQLSSEAFRTYILTTALGISPTLPVLEALLPNAKVRVPYEMGPYLDHSFLGIGPRLAGVESCVFTHGLNTVYVIFEQADYDTTTLDAVARAIAAGKGILVGAAG